MKNRYSFSPFSLIAKRCAAWLAGAHPPVMRLLFAAGLCLLAAGCAAPVVRSEVTAFHEWPAGMTDKSFVFERKPGQDNDLEYRNYETLVRAELLRLGFSDAANAASARLRVALQYSIKARDVRVIEPVIVDPWHGMPYYGPHWGPYGYYSPFYDPFWYGPPAVVQQERQYQLFTRQLEVVISRASDGKKLYDVTVVSEGRNGSLATVMPYMVKSAFAEFPGKSGMPHRVDLKMRN